MFNYWTLID